MDAVRRLFNEQSDDMSNVVPHESKPDLKTKAKGDADVTDDVKVSLSQRSLSGAYYCRWEQLKALECTP